MMRMHPYLVLAALGSHQREGLNVHVGRGLGSRSRRTQQRRKTLPHRQHPARTKDARDQIQTTLVGAQGLFAVDEEVARCVLHFI